MRTFDPGAGIVWWLRLGGHSIVEEDIDAFIGFLKAGIAPSAVSPPAELPSPPAPG
jgi:hypothetical protein